MKVLPNSPTEKTMARMSWVKLALVLALLSATVMAAKPPGAAAAQPSVALAVAALAQPDPEPLRIYHVDIGQGDATVIVGPGAPGERKVMVFDSGDPMHAKLDGGLRMIQALRDIGVARVDYIVVSHYDYDHIGGLARGKTGKEHSVLLGEDSAPGAKGVDEDGDGRIDWSDGEGKIPDREEMGSGDDFYSPDTLFIDRGSSVEDPTATTRRYWDYLNPARRYRVVRRSQMGRQFSLGPGAAAMVVCGNGFVLGHPKRVDDAESENERSVGLLVTYGKFDYLICGDLIGQKFGAEDARLEAVLGTNLVARGHSVELLHVNHHGAANATETSFIQAIRPSVAVISAGKTDYRHPAEDTLNTLFEAGARVYQTEEAERSSTPNGTSTVLGGHILAESDGQQFSIRNWGSLGSRVVNDAYPVRQ